MIGAALERRQRRFARRLSWIARATGAPRMTDVLVCDQIDKSFLALFFKKELLLLSC
jgi:hypothetical protein